MPKKIRIILYEGTDEQMASQFAEGRGLRDATHHLATTITVHTPTMNTDLALTILEACGLWPAAAKDQA